MAETWFTPKEWKARLVEFAGRRLLRNVANGEATTYDVSRSEGQVSQEGDAFNTKNMNDLEQRISNGFANAKTNIDVLNRDLHALNYKDLGSGGTAVMTLSQSISHVCFHHIAMDSCGRGRFQCADGWFDYDIIRSADDYCSGFVSGHTKSEAYQFYRERGADPVIKKLGSGTVSISNYIFNFNVSTSGNGSSSGNQGRSGKSEFILNTEDYETLTIGSYKIEGDGAHAAWNPRDCVALSVTINGIKTTVGEGGHAFDVKSADTAIIIASFGTNGNPDYGTWATLTVSSIMLV